MARLKTHYEEVIRPNLIKTLGYRNVFEVPRLEKIVVNMGVGEAVQENKRVALAEKDLAAIVGQSPVVTKARKSIAGFKLREGMPIGLKVTLRKAKMYEFLDRLVTIAMPRIRDFRGLSLKSFDGRGNYAIGIREHFIFPEINYDKVDQVLGMDVVFVTTAKSNTEAKALLEGFNMPFVKS